MMPGEYNSQPVRVFRERALPEPAIPAGYAALIHRYQLNLPLPPQLAAIAERHHPESTSSWQLLTPRHAPADSLAGHLAFALKWEGVDLAALASLFKAVQDDEIASVVRAKPTGAYSRRIWFLYEWLTNRQLDLPDPGKVSAVPVVDPKYQFAINGGARSSRHKVLNNLPGTPAFCPMVRRTATLRQYGDMDLKGLARQVLGRTHADVVARAGAFLLLQDSRASFNIEGENPSASRAVRWGQAIGQAGTRPLSVEELERLQTIVIGDARFVRLGLRNEGGFVGAHDRITREPLPDHISARAEDLRELVEGIVAYSDRALEAGVDPVVAAAVISFGFVYAHPFVDGNGRLHRWLIHHALAAVGYNPEGIVFPISAAILRQLNAYRAVLESYSKPLLGCVEWRPTAEGNVEVINDTGDYFRYFDATPHAEFLYKCVEQTVEQDLPDEVAFLEAYDRFAAGVKDMIEMPDQTVDLVHGFLQHGGGRFSKRARQKELAALSDQEAERLEDLYQSCFGETIEG